MKNIFKIFKGDLNDIKSNIPLLTVLIGLAILPSLYAWFNIKANWDPYGNTQNIKIAIVNEDTGSNILNKDINIGNKLVSQLKKNKALGWQFISENKANKGLQNGTYYATIQIPPNFSKDLTSLVTKDVKKADIIYTVNEKINAIAPKITDKGASSIQLQINQTVIKTVSTIVLNTLKDVGIDLEKELPKLVKVEDTLRQVQGKFKNIDDTINLASDATNQINDIVKSLQQDMPIIQETLENSMSLSKDVKSFLNDTKSNINNIGPIIKNDLQILNSISNSASTTVNNLISAIDNGYKNSPQLIDSLSNKLSNLSNISQSLSEFLIKLNKLSPNNSLQNTINDLNNINSNLNTAISKLDIIKKQLSNGESPNLDDLNGILKISNDINNVSSNILNNFDSKIINPINNIFNDGVIVANNILDILNNAENKLPKVKDILSTTLNFTGNANETVDFIKEKIPLAKKFINELVDAISNVNNSDDMKELISLIENDVTNRVNFLEQPVNVVSKTIYPTANYGSAMSPFYTVLALWVGVLLLCSLLSTEIHGDFKPYEVYFGRGFTFLLITLIQAFVASMGDIFILKVTVVNPVLFVLLSLFISLVFTFIVYSLVSVFGNIGKAMSVVLLVIQLGGSGGTFPIEVTPKFFQVVNPFLPFTYAISSLREALCGVYLPNLTKDIISLLVFLIVFISLNVILKGPINKLLSKFVSKLHESKLVEH